MLNEVKNPRGSAKDLQKSLETSTSLRYVKEEQCSREDTTEEATAVQKHGYTSEMRKRAPGCSTVLLAKYSVELKLCCLEGTHITMWRKGKAPISKPHPNSSTEEGASWFGAWTA
jgi:hypothetical protein